MKPTKWCRRKTCATPAWTPRSRSNVTRRERKVITALLMFFRYTGTALVPIIKSQMEQEGILRRILPPLEVSNEDK